MKMGLAGLRVVGKRPGGPIQLAIVPALFCLQSSSPMTMTLPSPYPRFLNGVQSLHWPGGSRQAKLLSLSPTL